MIGGLRRVMKKNITRKAVAIAIASTLAFGSLASAMTAAYVTKDLSVGAGVNASESTATGNPTGEPENPTGKPENPTGKPEVTPDNPTGAPENPTDAPTAGDVKEVVLDKTVESAVFWDAFTDYYTLNGNFDFTFKFKVFGGSQVYQNFAAVFTTNAERATNGYKEYAVVRADNWGWGGGDNMTLDKTAITYSEAPANEVLIDTLKEAEIVVNIKRNGNDFAYKYTATGANGTTYDRTATFTVKADDPMNIFFVVDGSKICAPGTKADVVTPTAKPTAKPTAAPTAKPTVAPTKAPAATGKVTKVTVKVPNKKAGKTIYVKKGDKVTLKATVKGTGTFTKGVTYKSSKTKVATVSSKGVVKAKKAGTAKITVTSKFDKTKKATITVKVSNKKDANKKLTLKAKKKTLKKGKTYTVAIKSITKKTTEKITFKSSKKSVATVDKYGVVKAKKKGKATITVKCGKKKATLKLTVKK